eukprot:4739528-Pyramimonas_sp.AAC.1
MVTLDRTQHVDSLGREMEECALRGGSHGEWRLLNARLRYVAVLLTETGRYSILRNTEGKVAES